MYESSLYYFLIALHMKLKGVDTYANRNISILMLGLGAVYMGSRCGGERDDYVGGFVWGGGVGAGRRDPDSPLVLPQSTGGRYSQKGWPWTHDERASQKVFVRKRKFTVVDLLSTELFGNALALHRHDKLQDTDSSVFPVRCILYTKEGFHGISWHDKSYSFSFSILLLVVIIIMVVFVVVVLVVVVIAIVFPLVPVFLLGLLALAIDAACAFRAEEMPSLISCRMAAKVMAGVSDVDVLLGGILSTKDNA
ncbi:hypothetical protein Tco_0951953 [Tanacetum coccineum]|uniref:Uncharacterized protein n=1 Tax=Tanacetum coccineum TaxID=301880 RepID=A0ABQ5DWB4_9ASTR